MSSSVASPPPKQVEVVLRVGWRVGGTAGTEVETRSVFDSYLRCVLCNYELSACWGFLDTNDGTH